MMPYLIIGVLSVAVISDPMSTGGMVQELVRSPRVIHALKLSPEQLEQIGLCRRAGIARIMEARKQLNSSSKGHTVQPADVMRQVQAEVDREMLSILSPEQADRLLQIIRQYRHKANQFSFGLGSKEVAEELRLTENQRDLLQAKSREFESAFQELLKRHRDRIGAISGGARENIFSVLSPSQRAAYEEVFGEPFQVRGEHRRIVDQLISERDFEDFGPLIRP